MPIVAAHVDHTTPLMFRNVASDVITLISHAKNKHSLPSAELVIRAACVAGAFKSRCLGHFPVSVR